MTGDSWQIEIPGLTEERAIELRETLLPASPFGVVLYDPSIWMMRAHQRADVELQIKLLQAGLSDSTLSREERGGLMSMLEDCQEWLRSTTAREK